MCFLLSMLLALCFNTASIQADRALANYKIVEAAFDSTDDGVSNNALIDLLEQTGRQSEFWWRTKVVLSTGVEDEYRWRCVSRAAEFLTYAKWRD